MTDQNLKIEQIDEFIMCGEGLHLVDCQDEGLNPAGRTIENFCTSIDTKVIPPIKCHGCKKYIMAFTFYDANTNGRAVLCGAINPYEIRRGVDFYYCGSCSQSDQCDKKEYNSDESFNYRLDIPRQKKIQQLNCDSNCVGRCLLNTYIEYVDDHFYRVKSCILDNNEIIVIVPKVSYTGMMSLAADGDIIEVEKIIVCPVKINPNPSFRECDDGTYSLDFGGRVSWNNCEICQFVSFLPHEDCKSCTGSTNCNGSCIEEFVSDVRSFVQLKNLTFD